MSFYFSPNSCPVFSDVFRNLSDFESLLEPCLDCQPVIISKVLPAHRYLQSEGRTGTTILEDDAKRNHEVTTAAPWFPSHAFVSNSFSPAFISAEGAAIPVT